MLQHDTEKDGFVTINLDTEACQVCLQESSEEVTHCRICEDLLRNGTVHYGFNNIPEITHGSKLGHDRCFREDHCQLLRRSMGSPPSEVLHASFSQPRMQANHLHATFLLKPSHLSVDWIHPEQFQNNHNNNFRSWSNPNTRSSSPVHLGRRSSNPLNCDHQFLELRRNTAKYLFGENSPEFEQYSSSQIVPSVNFKEDRFSSVDGRSSKRHPRGDITNIPVVDPSWTVIEHNLVRQHAVQPREVSPTYQRRGPDLREHRFLAWQRRVNRSVNNNNGEALKSPSKGAAVFDYTKREMENLSLGLVKEILDSLQHIITETSTDLVALLEERDNLKHENDTRHVTIQKLVHIQQTVKQKSSPNMPRK